jgi:sulfide:quinone oxidoreductase
MELHKINDDLTVTGQIDAGAVPLLAERGFRSIICNRPDGEAPDQPDSGAIEQAAAAQGLRFVNLPVSPNSIGDADASAFAKALDELHKPILAYCRAGTRSAVLWSLSQAGKRPVQDILLSAMRAGYDMSALVPRLQKLHDRG